MYTSAKKSERCPVASPEGVGFVHRVTVINQNWARGTDF